MKVRTRFAPSPTGALHVGGIRTALFAWLVARQAGGQFILRLEDTDKKREQPGAEQQIEESLRSLGLNYDEGPDIGGPYAPYRQSQRLDSYKQWAQKLIAGGRAYADPYTPEQVEAFRQTAQAAKQPFLYRDHRPENPPEWDGSRPLRFKSDPKAYRWHDEVMGDLSTGPEVIDDFILIKSDGYPTYNFSHVIDDAEMRISHVIRGQEFLPSTPNYLNLYEALEVERPALATMPHILGPGGKKKLSKRDGAKDVLEYIKEGYLPEALISFIATLGWNDGTEQEIFTVRQLIDKFSLDRVHRSGAHFDEKRLEWVNGHFIRSLPLDELYKRAGGFWPQSAKAKDENYKKAVLGLVQERLKYLSELPSLTGFFFEAPKKESGLIPSDRPEWLKAAVDELKQSDFSEADLTERLNGLLKRFDTSPAVLFRTLSMMLSGSKQYPPLPGMLHVLGKAESIKRLQSALAES